MTELVVGPFNRVEGDLEVHLTLRDGHVAEAWVNSPLFRGFEQMLDGKDPRDALTLTPRICGICSISQSTAAAQGLVPAPMGEITAALIHAVENAADHLTHFNLFFMADFARPAYRGRVWHDRALTRFTAMEGSAVRQAVEARAALLHILGLLAGKWPHTLAIQPGGVTKTPTPRDLVRIAASLRAFRRYLEEVLFGAAVEEFAALATPATLQGWTSGDAGLFLEIAADLGLARIGSGPGRYLSYGAYPLPEAGFGFAGGLWQADGLSPVDPARIVEDLSHAWMLGPAAHPHQGATRPDEDMRDGAYSWCKAPRYDGAVVETGALARQITDGHPLALALARLGGGGVMGRVAGRLLELARTQLFLETCLARIDPRERFMARGAIPSQGQGAGLVEAARGALGHWLTIEKGRIARYQIIAPTTWNFSPRDAGGVPGALEAALVGAKVGEGEVTPLTVQHIVRSFDPCMVCTVH